MHCGAHLFDPMRWYLRQLRWTAPSEGPGVTALELALDFEATLGVPPQKPGPPDGRTLRDKRMLFSLAAMRVAELCRGRVAPGQKIKDCRALNGLKYPPAPGFTATAQLLDSKLV